jgi:hypothetical protein
MEIPLSIQPTSVPVEDSNTSRWKRLSPKATGTLIVLLLLFMAVLAFGVYHLAGFLITVASSGKDAPEWINPQSVPVWVFAILVVVSILGVIRLLTSYITRTISFVFKFAQSDLVTIVLAVTVNIVLLFLNAWMTTQIIQWIQDSGFPSFFMFENWLSVAVMFCMLAGALVWIPRIGVYGENRLGQFDD